MRKYNHLLILLLILAAMTMLAGCGSKATASKPADPAPAAAYTPAPTYTPVVSQEDLRETYLNDLIANSSKFSDNNYRLSDLLSNPDPTSSFWRYEVSKELLNTKMLVAEARLMKPPVQFQKSHRFYMLAIDDMDFIADNLPKCLDTLDMEMLDQIGARFTSAVDNIDKAVIQMKVEM